MIKRYLVLINLNKDFQLYVCLFESLLKLHNVNKNFMK